MRLLQSSLHVRLASGLNGMIYVIGPVGNFSAHSLAPTMTTSTNATDNHLQLFMGFSFPCQTFVRLLLLLPFVGVLLAFLQSKAPRRHQQKQTSTYENRGYGMLQENPRLPCEITRESRRFCSIIGPMTNARIRGAISN